MTKDILIVILSILVIGLLAWIIYVKRQAKKTILENELLMEQARVKGEEAIKEARDRTELVANMSHEIRVPMNAISCATELLSKEELPPSSKSYLNVLRNSTESLLNLVNGILDFSKMDSGKMSLVEGKYSVKDMLWEVKSIYEIKQNNKNVSFTIDINPSVPSYMVGDSVRIIQILINLLTNAIKYTTRGCISLKIDFNEISKEEIDLILTVKDTGCGISPQTKHRLENTFAHVGGNVLWTDGQGMGLSVVNQLVNLMGGSVAFESELTEGTTFVINIRQKCPEAYEPVCDEKVKQSILADVIVWEDNAYYKENLVEVLSSIGVPAKTVNHASELISILSSVKVDYLFTTESHFDDGVNAINKVSPSTIPVKLVESDEPADASFDGNFAVVRRPLDLFEILEVLRKREYKDMHTAGHTGKLMIPDAKILIVDDNRVNLKVGKALLENFSAQVTAVDTGFEAVELIRMGECFDLILMDHMMPGMDGIEAANRIWEIQGNNRTPIIALTANAGGEVEKLFFEAGMNDFIPKPIVMKHLNYVLQKWLPKSKQIFAEVNTSQSPLLRMHSKAFQPEWGLSKVWDDKKIFIGILRVYVDKSEELVNEMVTLSDIRESVKVAEELEKMAVSAGAARMPELLHEAIALANAGEIAVYKSHLDFIVSENQVLVSKIQEYLDKEDASEILTFE